MKLSELAALLQGQLIGPDQHYTSISLDSRRMKAGALFIALAGERFDGHAFIDEARKQGAVAAVVDKSLSSELALVKVNDTRKALGQLAQAHRSLFSIPMIALTGSCGKTTTKEMLRAILSEVGSVLASTKSFNNDIGVPLTLLDLNASHRFAVVEMGANHLGEIAYLSQITKPNIALITNIGPAHLQGFGSIAKIAEAKSEIFLGLVPDGIAVINADDPFEQAWKRRLASHALIRFGFKESADFTAKKVHVDAQGRTQFSLVTPKGEITIQLALPGRHNLLNALAAAAVAQQVGASLNAIKMGLEKMSAVPGRLAIVKTKAGASIIDDTYNANPSSVAVALQLLVHYPGRHIFVMGDMGELGERAEYYHRQIGELAKALRIESVYTCGELTALTTQAFGASARHFAQQEDLIQALKPLLQKGVTLLIKGSRCAQMERIVAALLQA